ncbi:hypothetical protein ISS86_01245 [Candidatus Microgenomates bacterium]|nr:hypothetical protein [Candidatus Microgenomates bacterium]
MKKTSLLLIIIFSILLGAGLFWLISNKDKVLLSFLDKKVIEEGVSPTPISSPQPTPIPTTFKFTNWISYVNKKYQYQFKYDSDWFFNNHLSGSELNDRIVLQGDIQNKGWPNIEINLQYFDPQPLNIDQLKTHLQNTYGDGATVEKTVFGIDDIAVVKVSFPASPQAYASDNYYFMHAGQNFLISMTDNDKPEAQEIYQYFLDKFKIN